MLRCALESIASQSAVGSIAQLLVIENLGNSESGEVCRQFANLPVEYVLRDPPLPVGFESLKDAHRRVTGDYTAILFDDDWWMPDHLANAIIAIKSEPNVIASYSSYVTIADEHGYVNGTGNSFLNWFAAKSGLSNDRWIFDLEDLLVANLVATTGSFMTLLVESEVWKKCLPCISHGNPYDVDRLLAVELGRYGKVAFTRRATAYVRTHPSQETHRIQAGGDASRWWRDSTERLISLATSVGIDLAKAFASRMQGKCVDVATLGRHACHDAIEHLSTLGILPSLPAPLETALGSSPSITSQIYRSLFPPLLQTTIDRVRKSRVRKN